MKRGFVLTLGLVLGGASGAQTAGTGRISTRDGEYEIFGYSETGIVTLPNKRIRITLAANPGGKVQVVVASEGIRLEANAFTVLATLDRRLLEAEMKGGILVNARRPSSVDGKFQTVRVEAPSAKYTASNNTVVIPGRIELDRQDPAAGEALIASGSRGTVVLSAPEDRENALRKAILDGPVAFTLKGKRTDEGKALPFAIHGGGDQMTYDDPTRKLLVSGNVKLDGDDPTLAGKLTGIDQAIITLDKNREVESIQLKGDPGRTSIQTKGKNPPPR